MPRTAPPACGTPAPRAEPSHPAPLGKGAALLAAGAVIVLWGVSFPVSRVAVREIPPLALAAGRFALAAAVLWPAVRRRRLSLPRADVPAVLVLGLLGVTLYFAFENYGLVFTTASHASLIVSAVPLGSALVEAVRRRRAPRPLPVAGMVAASAGVLLIVGLGSAGWRGVLGDLLMLGAMTSWVAYTFRAQDLMARTPALLVTAATMLAGAVTLLPLAAVEALVVPWRMPSLPAWAALAYLGLLCSAAAYLLWNLALPVLGVSVANNLLNGVPLVSVLTGVVALGEPLTGAILLGGALILTGVVVVERTSPPR